jgi:putative transcriptional regulator
MPIVVRLDRLLDEREMTLTDLSSRIGLTVANLSILKTGKARAIRFSTLEAICHELGCQPGELLEHHSSGGTPPTLADDHQALSQVAGARHPAGGG